MAGCHEGLSLFLFSHHFLSCSFNLTFSQFLTDGDLREGSPSGRRSVFPADPPGVVYQTPSDSVTVDEEQNGYEKSRFFLSFRPVKKDRRIAIRIKIRW